MAIAILTDGGVDLRPETMQEFGIHLLPSRLHLDISLYDHLETSEVLERMKAGQRLSTAHIDDHLIRDRINKLLLQHDGILLITVSALLDDFNSKAVQMAGEFGGRVTVMDSRSVSVGLGLQLIRAARLAQEGRSVQEIMVALQRVQANNLHMLVVKTLDFMRMSRRISGTQAVLGKFLGINPILGVRDGKITGVEQVRGFQPALNRMKAKGIEFGRRNARANILFWFTPGSETELQQLRDEMLTTGYFNDMGSVLSGPAIAANTGPGAIGFFIEPAEV